MSRRILGLTALVVGAAVIFSLPAASLGSSKTAVRDAKLRQTTEKVREVARKVGARLDRTASGARKANKNVTGATGGIAGRLQSALADSARRDRATATDPQIQPPMRDTNPHGQGSVAVVDADPSAERPAVDSTDSHNSGEDIIAGRSRAEQNADGSFDGHITIVELLGNELLGVNTTSGQTRTGPLEPLQQGILDPLCNGTGNQVCLSVLTADSTTTATGSTNDFAIARAQLGGPTGLGVGAAESQGAVQMDGQCQNSAGVSRTANVVAGPGVVAAAANSASASRQCPGAAETTTQTSEVVNLGGVGVPLPAAGCANGTPDTRFAPLAPVATIVCNADETASSGVRQALDVFVLSGVGSSLLQESTAQSESKAVAVAAAATPQCSDGVDNDGDGKIDFPADPGCSSATDDSEAGGGPQCSDGIDNDGDGKIDFPADKGCTSASDTSEAGDGTDSRGAAESGDSQCDDGKDNDGDGVIDAADPGCHTDGNANNKASYDPDDDSEADGGGGGVSDDSLAFTGSDVIGLALAGLFVLVGGLLLRRREPWLS